MRLRKVTVSLLGVFLSGCIFSAIEHKQTAEKAAHRFHDLFNARQYETIYKESDESFRNRVNRSDFLEFLNSIEKDLGKVEQDPKKGEWHVKWNQEMGTHVTMSFTTQYTRGWAKEQFIWRIENRSARLTSYSIHSELGTLPIRHPSSFPR